MQAWKILVAVPARLQSSRLPGKVLADIAGKPMLQHVLENCKKASMPHEVILCTDSSELSMRAKEWGVRAIMTSSDCQSGSDRIASVINHLVGTANTPANKTLIINVQGDQPFIDPKIIDQMADQFTSQEPSPQVLTPIHPLPAEQVHNPNVVKTLTAADGRAIYFSRSALPHVRGIPSKDWPKTTTYWGHVGIYGYRADILQKWRDLPYSNLEKQEKLEQLRLIEAGITIGTFPVSGDFLSVDTTEQLEQARKIAKTMF